MRKILLIVGMLIALLTLIYSFISNATTGQFFGLEMNIWIYRLVWLALFGLIFKDYLKESKK